MAVLNIFKWLLLILLIIGLSYFLSGLPSILSVIGALIIILMAIGIWIVCSRKRQGDKDGDNNYEQVEGMPARFSYEDLKAATMDFQTKLGEGGFGSVFEGQLSSGEKIAVKRLDGLGQGKKEFLAEVMTIGNIHHVNLVRLIGFCAEKLNRLLVYEFMCNGSLDKWIFSKNPAEACLDWQLRRNIILDIAKGLAYLHDECRQRIVHLDIKPQNILLDSNLRARVSDFGLSKLVDRDQSQIVTTMRGTPGYLAPEWLTSVITEKADVYSFGIVVMEVVCGRKNLDRSQPEELMHLFCLFKTKAEADQLVDLVDKYIVDNMEVTGVLEAVKMMRLAAWCLQGDYTRRPSMSVAVKVIEGTMDIDANLDYSFPNPTLVVGINNDMEMKTTATILPSILSAPR